MINKEISYSTLRRLPVYLHFLKTIQEQKPTVSSSYIAECLGLNDVQVRKDLGMVSGSGRPRTGYVTIELIEQIADCIGCKEISNAILVGAGNLGKALMSHPYFSDYGLHIVAGFDVDTAVIGKDINGCHVYALDEMSRVCANNNARMGIITVPAAAAQQTCDMLVANGVRAVWNFAPTLLKVPKWICVENENLASSLAILSKHLKEMDGEE